MDEKKVIESAQTIKDYCIDQQNCRNCVFNKEIDGDSSCIVQGDCCPDEWEVPSLPTNLDKETEKLIKQTIANLEELLESKKSC